MTGPRGPDCNSMYLVVYASPAALEYLHTYSWALREAEVVKATGSKKVDGFPANPAFPLHHAKILRPGVVWVKDQEPNFACAQNGPSGVLQAGPGKPHRLD
jgi:hypothetical protein